MKILLKKPFKHTTGIKAACGYLLYLLGNSVSWVMRYNTKENSIFGWSKFSIRLSPNGKSNTH